MKKLLTVGILGLLILAGGLSAQQSAATPSSEVSATVPEGAVLPGFREETAGVALGYNPFEPIREVKTDENSETAKGIIKRLKGFVVQKVGAPLLVIDNKSYKVGDKVALETPASGSAGTVEEGKSAPKSASAESAEAAAPAVGATATIISVTPTEAVFRIDDESGFGSEEFKIYYNFSQITDSAGNPAYTLWSAVATGFFVTDDGVLVAPLDIVRGGDISVQTPTGPSRATLFESDEKRGIALLKVYTNSLPLPLANTTPDIADAIFGAAFWPQKAPQFCLKEGFVSGAGDFLEISPPIDGELEGAAVLNKKGELLGMLVGQTQTLSKVARLNETDTIFRKVFRKNPETGKPEQGVPAGKLTRAQLEQAVVPILKRCDKL